MKSGYKIALTLVALTGILYFLDSVYEFGLRHNQNLKLSRIVNSPPETEVLFLGPCEPHWALSPALLQKYTDAEMYNLALNNSDFADNFLHLYLYLKSNKAPRFIFLYVTPGSFDETINRFNSFRFGPYLSDPVVDSVVKDMDPEFHFCSAIPFLRFSYYNSECTFNVLQGYKHCITNRDSGYYHDGFEPPARRAIGVEKESYTLPSKDSISYVWCDRREQYLKKIIDLCKSKGPELILFELPVFSEASKLEKHRKMFEQRIMDIALGYGIDFTQFKEADLCNNPSNFNAPRNLNKKGVELFSGTFGKFLRGVVNRSGH